MRAYIVIDLRIIYLDTGVYSANTPMSDNDYEQLKWLVGAELSEVVDWIHSHIFVAINSARNEINASTYASARSSGNSLNANFYDLTIEFGSFITITVNRQRLSQKKY